MQLLKYNKKLRKTYATKLTDIFQISKFICVNFTQQKSRFRKFRMESSLKCYSFGLLFLSKK